MPGKPTKDTAKRILELLGRDEIEDGVVHDISLFGRKGIEFLMDAAVGKVLRASTYQRTNAIYALGRLKEERAIKNLAALLKGSNERMRVYAVLALGRIGNGEARKALVKVLSARSASLAERSYAIESLGKTGQEKEAQALEKFVKRTDFPLFEDKAEAALREIRSRLPQKPVDATNSLTEGLQIQKQKRRRPKRKRR